MLSLSRDRLRRRGLEGCFKLHHGDVSDLPNRASFDAATVIMVLQFLPDDGTKARLLRAIGQRLIPGAPLILVDLHGEPQTDEFGRLLAGWKRYMLLMGMNATECETLEGQLATGIHYVPESRMIELLNVAGFGEITPFYRAFLYGGWIARRR